MESNAARPWMIRDLSGGEIVSVLLLAAFVAGVLALQMRDRTPSSDAAYVQNYLLVEIPLAVAPGALAAPVADAAGSSELQDDGDTAQADLQLAASIIGQGPRDDGSAIAPRSAMHSSQRDFGREFGREFRQGLVNDRGREPIVLADGQRLLDVDFDLGVQGARAGDLQVEKPVNLDGRRLGLVAVSIDRNSQLHLSVADLGAVLPEGQAARLPAEGDLVSFDALRASGIDIRYDPVGDVLMLNLPTRS